MASKLERVELGNDDDGDPITSCVIVPAELAAKGPKLSKVNRFALDLLQKLIAAEGVPPPRDSGLPDHVRSTPPENGASASTRAIRRTSGTQRKKPICARCSTCKRLN
jgi:hypothetical protein